MTRKDHDKLFSTTKTILSQNLPDLYFKNLVLIKSLDDSNSTTVKTNINHTLKWNGPFKNQPNSKTLNALVSDHMIRNDMLNRKLDDDYFSNVKMVRPTIGDTSYVVKNLNQTSVDDITDEIARQLLAIKRDKNYHHNFEFSDQKLEVKKGEEGIGKYEVNQTASQSISEIMDQKLDIKDSQVDENEESTTDLKVKKQKKIKKFYFFMFILN